jgi:hypothetical protein
LPLFDDLALFVEMFINSPATRLVTVTVYTGVTVPIAEM